ncbi:beta-glucan synthesis-associated protein [Thecaphora frezii]
MSYSRVDNTAPLSPRYANSRGANPANAFPHPNQEGAATTSALSRGPNNANASESSSHIGGSEFGPYAHLRSKLNGGDDRAKFAPSGAAGVGSSLSSHGSSQQYSAAQSAQLLDSKDAEPDDYLHNPDANWDKSSHAFSMRGFLNILTLTLIGLALLMLFAGYPILANMLKVFDNSTKGGYNLGGTNGSGQVPELQIRQLIDKDTKDKDKAITLQGVDYQLVFSDEFEEEGRTFWPGDDPFWEAMDFYYGATFDFEWYSPEAVNTTNGALLITMEQKITHNLNFQSGMVQSWNKFCFQGGYIEFSIKQPGSPTTMGYWPAAWIMGNLGRPGYLASTHGMWPYSYQGCDTGILDGQLYLNGSGPYEALHSTATYAVKGRLNQLPGMRNPSCTCPGQSHPGPNVNVGRSSPELDIIEAQIQTRDGRTHSYASQSVQTAPYDVRYEWDNSTATIYNDSITTFNTYTGSTLQEAVSGVTQIPDRGFFGTDDEFVTFGLAYEPDWNADGSGWVVWYIDGKPTWKVTGASIGPVPELDVSQRTIPTEPMSIIMNLGIASGFQPVHFEEGGVSFPAYMAFDYVRVYQRPDAIKVSCDPKDYPTAQYIQDHIKVYSNPNLTLFTDAYDWPTNKLANGTC